MLQNSLRLFESTFFAVGTATANNQHGNDVVAIVREHLLCDEERIVLSGLGI